MGTLALFLALCFTGKAVVDASDPAESISTSVVNVKSSDAVYYGSSSYDSNWGAELPSQQMNDGKKRKFYPLVYTTSSLTDPFGCTSKAELMNQTTNFTLPDDPFVLLVDRGHCTFAEKALYAQELGASALIITDTLQQVYNRTLVSDATEEDIAMEYSCANGQATAGSGADLTDFTSDNWVDLVNVAACTGNSKCASDKCIPTGKGQEVCCVWDLPDTMGFGSSDVVEDRDEITISVIRLTMADGDALKTLIENDPTNNITFYERDPPTVDPSQVLLWLIAVATVMTGGYKGSAYERTKAQLKSALARVDVTSSEESAQARVAYEEHDEQRPTNEVMDLTIYHAVGFLVIGSAFLLLIFYVNVVLVIVVAFAISSVSCTFMVLWSPLFNRCYLLRFLPFKKCTWQSGYLEPAAWTIGDLVALVFALTGAIFWFVMRHHNFAWVFQDIFGICLCMMFLKTIRLPNLKIATVLLVLVFIYDIFMVFISSYIFGESVMIKAAKGGSQNSSSVSEGFCLRYPTHSECQSEEMPILLRMPKILDWRDGTTMLGLGDIVLPGLLIVFCARYDYVTRGQLYGRVKPDVDRAKSLHRPIDNSTLAADSAELSSDTVCPSRRGLFGLLIWGYALGLFFANLAVVLTNEGQPALMYLVPCTLGLLAIVSWRRGILHKLWEGPPELIPGYASGNAPDSITGTPDLNLNLEHGGAHPVHFVHSDMVLMKDATPMSGSYVISENTPQSSHLATTKE